MGDPLGGKDEAPTYIAPWKTPRADFLGAVLSL